MRELKRRVTGTTNACLEASAVLAEQRAELLEDMEWLDTGAEREWMAELEAEQDGEELKAETEMAEAELEMVEAELEAEYAAEVREEERNAEFAQGILMESDADE